jgi:tetratricopeptide (TPR) repeat protein
MLSLLDNYKFLMKNFLTLDFCISSYPSEIYTDEKANQLATLAINHLGDGNVKKLKLAVAILTLGTLAIGSQAEAKNVFHSQQTQASQIIAQAPNSPPANNNNAANYLKRAIERFQGKDYSGAIDDFNQALKLEPKNTSAYVGRGAAKFLLEQFQAAKTDFDTALEITPDIAYAHYFRGFTNYALKDKAAAIADLRKASTLFQKEGNQELAQKADNAAKQIETN